MSKKNRASDRAARAAAAIAEQQARGRRRRNLMVGGVVGALVLIVLVGWLLTRSLDTTGDVAAPAAGSDARSDDRPGRTRRTRSIIYEDFLCPFCGEFERASRDDLAKLAADGKVQVEYRPFNLLSHIGDYSERSTAALAVVLDASGADVAKKFHDLLYEDQPSESGPFPSDADLVKLAVKAGADEADVADAIERGEGKAWVERATQAALDAGVRGTPTILLDGEVFPDGRTPQLLAENLVDRLQ